MPGPAKPRASSALPGGSASSTRSRKPEPAGHTADPDPPIHHTTHSTTMFNPSITLTSYKTLPLPRPGTSAGPATHTHAAASSPAAVNTKPRSPYLAHLHAADAHSSHNSSTSSSPSAKQQQQQQQADTAFLRRPSPLPLDKDPLSSPGAVELLKDDIRRLHQALQVQGAGAAAAGTGAAGSRASGSGASGASMLKHSPAVSGTKGSAGGQLEGPGAGPAPAPAPASAAAAALELEAELEAAGGSRAALLDMVATRAVQLMQHAANRLRSDAAGPAPAAPAPEAAPRPKPRAQSAHVASRRDSPSSSLYCPFAATASSLSATSASSAASDPGPPGPSVAAALLENLSLLADLQRQVAGREATLKAAEERAAETKSKLELSQQDNTLLRNIVAELQAGSRLYSGMGAGGSGEVTRPASARPLGAADSGKPDAALLKQVQTLSKEVFDLKRQLETGARALRQQQAESEALTSQLEAARKALAASEGRESKVARERDQLSVRCKQFESNLGQATQECDRLARECDQGERRRKEAEALLAAAARDKGRASAAACQTEVDGRDEEIRSQLHELERLRGKLEVQGRDLADARRLAAGDKSSCSLLQQQLEQQQLRAAGLEERLAAAEAAAEAGAAAAGEVAEAERRLVAARMREQVLQSSLDKMRFEEQQARGAQELALQESRQQVRTLEEANSGLQQRVAELSLQGESLQAQVEGLERERDGLGASREEREQRLAALEGVLLQVQELEAALQSREEEARTLGQQLAESQDRWNRVQVDLEAERKRLANEWGEAHSLRSSLQQEAATVKAMGTLVQAGTLKFDLSGMMSVSALGAGKPGGARPMSAMGPGGGGQEVGAAAQMRLGALVKELQEQVAAQGRQLGERQRQAEALGREAQQEQAVRLQLERAAREMRQELERVRQELAEATARAQGQVQAAELQLQLQGQLGAREEAERKLGEQLQQQRLAREAAERRAGEMEALLGEAERRLEGLQQGAGGGAGMEEAAGLRRQLEELRAAAEAAAEQEATLKGVNKEMQKMCERLQRQLTSKSRTVEQLEQQLAQAQESALYLQQQADYDNLLQQLQIARANLAMCAEKLEGAERTIYQQDERIALLQSRVKVLEDEADSAAFAATLTAQQGGPGGQAAAAERPAAFAGSGSGFRSSLGPGTMGGGGGSDGSRTRAGGGNGFVMRPSSASLVGKVAELEGGGGYVPRGAAVRGPGEGAQGSPDEWASPVRTSALWGGAVTAAAAGGALQAAGRPHSSAVYSSRGGRASAVSAASPAPLAPQGAGRPSTAVTRKTLVLLSTSSSIGIDEADDAGDWVPV